LQQNTLIADIYNANFTGRAANNFRTYMVWLMVFLLVFPEYIYRIAIFMFGKWKYNTCMVFCLCDLCICWFVICFFSLRVSRQNLYIIENYGFILVALKYRC